MQEIFDIDGKWLVDDSENPKFRFLIEPSDTWHEKNRTLNTQPPEPSTEEILLVALQEIQALKDKVAELEGE